MLRNTIVQALKDFEGNGGFIKINCKSAQDGRWLNHTLECLNSDDVFALMKSSQLVTSEIESCIQKNIQLELVIKKFYNLNKSMEFRVFCKKDKILGIS